MSTNESNTIQPSEDWGVVLQSVPSKHRKEIVKRLEQIFNLEKRDAEQVLSNMPLILIDGLSFGLAARIKKFFVGLGALAETTNHDMIKKNCFQIVWPQIPDLAFFLKDETKSQESPVPVKKESLRGGEKTKASETSPSQTPQGAEVKGVPVASEPSKVEEVPLSVKPVEESPKMVPDVPPASEERPVISSQANVDSEWERRARELNEKLRSIQNEKQQLHDQQAEETEKVKNEFQQRLDEERQKREQIAKAYDDLQKEAQKQEALTKEGEEWRAKAVALGEKVRELETNLMQKTSAIEHLIQEKDDFAKKAEQLGPLSGRMADLEKNVAVKDQEKAVLQSRIDEFQNKIADFERIAGEAKRELENSRGSEQRLLQKVSELERNVETMKESLAARDNVLAQFEKQILELGGKVREYEALQREHAQLVQERAKIRGEYDAKLVEQETRLAKIEEDHRRYRSRVDRKSAAATRELGQWVRGVDTVRQGLQKLILFLGSESAVLETDKKPSLKSPLTRGPDVPGTGNS